MNFLAAVLPSPCRLLCKRSSPLPLLGRGTSVSPLATKLLWE
ncbi:hypothetical protein DFR24_1763 [Panacagrimonas perspica]|uniref:Uncharacterized protein n=1 Tax=Panacagrimonas perspica TaxID=381431 RepID=A0A4R7PFB3_9GAMM|nr:hypothetical protein DFR24_1763 [Panacagrimonas perspica]